MGFYDITKDVLLDYIPPDVALLVTWLSLMGELKGSMIDPESNQHPGHYWSFLLDQKDFKNPSSSLIVLPSKDRCFMVCAVFCTCMAISLLGSLATILCSAIWTHSIVWPLQYEHSAQGIEHTQSYTTPFTTIIPGLPPVL